MAAAGGVTDSPTAEWSEALATLSQSLWLQLEHFLRPPPHALCSDDPSDRPGPLEQSKRRRTQRSEGSGQQPPPSLPQSAPLTRDSLWLHEQLLGQQSRPEPQSLPKSAAELESSQDWWSPEERVFSPPHCRRPDEGDEGDLALREIASAAAPFVKARPMVPRLSAAKHLTARPSEDSHRLLAVPDEDAGDSGSVDQSLDEVEVALSTHSSWQPPQKGADEGEVELDRVVQEVGQRIGRTAQETEPILTLLKSNWYNTVDSLALASSGDLVNLGVPSRFAKELLFEVGITFRGEVPAKTGPGNLRGRNTPQLGKRKNQSSSEGRKARRYIEFLSRSLVLTLRHTSRERLPRPDSDGFYDVGEVLRRVKYPPAFRGRSIDLAQFNSLAQGRDRSGHLRLTFCNLDQKGVDLEVVRVKLGKPHKHRHLR